VRVRETDDLAQALVLCTDTMHVAKHQSRERFDELQRRTKLQRGWGDCYGYLLVASGCADIMLDPIMNPWDVLPVIPVIRGAGGVITTWQGGDPVKGNSAVSAPRGLHAQAIAILNA
jgi:myo-inositol-1(or 4)-monophosphatase